MSMTWLACRLTSLAPQQAISEMFLKAMDSCCREDLQKEIILLLPELLSEDEHEVQDPLQHVAAS